MKKVEIIEVMKEVQMAPSAHNTQPIQWTWDGELLTGRVLPECLLPIADKENHDLQLSFGAQLEGLDLALSKRNCSAKLVINQEMEKAFKISFDHKEKDELCDYVSLRRTYRGSYKKPDSSQLKALKEEFHQSHSIEIVESPSVIKEVAKLYDEASSSFFKNEDYLGELNLWLRFDKRSPLWLQDGLNQEAMSLNIVESFFASKILKPKVYGFLDKLGIASSLVAEAGKIKNSTALFCLVGAPGGDNISLGRQFYRAWLQAEKCGFSLCPLSNLVDHPQTNKKLQETLRRPEKSQILKIFRLGPRPSQAKIPRSFRRDFHSFFQIKGELS